LQFVIEFFGGGKNISWTIGIRFEERLGEVAFRDGIALDVAQVCVGFYGYMRPGNYVVWFGPGRTKDGV